MTERYVPTGTPPTDYERELLTILAEECGEVVQGVCKILRFGKEDKPPDKPGAINSVELGLEAGDLMAMITLCIGAGLLDLADVAAGMRRKRAKLEKYLMNAPLSPQSPPANEWANDDAISK